MRFILIAAILLVLLSCKKEEHNPTNSLIGSWSWESTSGGFSGSIEYSSPGNSQELIFHDTHHYTWLKNGSIYKEGTYTLQIGESFITHKTRCLLDLGQISIPVFFTEIENNTLFLCEDVMDGLNHVFQKL